MMSVIQYWTLVKLFTTQVICLQRNCCPPIVLKLKTFTLLIFGIICSRCLQLFILSCWIGTFGRPIVKKFKSKSSTMFCSKIFARYLLHFLSMFKFNLAYNASHSHWLIYFSTSPGKYREALKYIVEVIASEKYNQVSM